VTIFKVYVRIPIVDAIPGPINAEQLAFLRVSSNLLYAWITRQQAMSEVTVFMSERGFHVSGFLVQPYDGDADQAHIPFGVALFFLRGAKSPGE
jgi:hypothetical protein